MGGTHHDGGKRSRAGNHAEGDWPPWRDPSAGPGSQPSFPRKRGPGRRDASAQARRLWKSGSPLSLAMTEERVTHMLQHESAFSRRIAPEFLIEWRPERTEGAGNAGCWPQPMARLQKSKQAAVTTGPAGSSGIPCTMVLTLIARSPWEPGFLAPIAREIITRELGLSVGRPGPRAFTSASDRSSARECALRPDTSTASHAPRP